MPKFHESRASQRPQCFHDMHKEKWYCDSAEVYKIEYRGAMIYPTE